MPSIERLTAEVERLEEQAARKKPAPILEQLRRSPSKLLTLAGKGTRCDWQLDLLRHPRKRVALLCAKQTGKSTAVAALALKAAMLQPGKTAVVVAPSQRQANRLLLRAKDLYTELGRPVEADLESESRILFANGSRIEAFPGSNPTSIFGESADIAAVDEAAYASEGLMAAVWPMLGALDGSMCLLSTAGPPAGMFYEIFTGEDPRWHRVKVTGEQSPLLTADFLAEMRATIGERRYRRDYGCEFLSLDGSLFDWGQLQACLTRSYRPLVTAG